MIMLILNYIYTDANLFIVPGETDTRRYIWLINQPCPSFLSTLLLYLCKVTTARCNVNETSSGLSLKVAQIPQRLKIQY